MNDRKKSGGLLLSVLLGLLALLFLLPILVIFMNSFKGRFFIADAPFALPSAETFAGVQNYINGCLLYTSAAFRTRAAIRTQVGRMNMERINIT